MLKAVGCIIMRLGRPATATPLINVSTASHIISSRLSALARRRVSTTRTMALSSEDMTDVTRSNFSSRLGDIRKALTSCAFFAFDLEMTGLEFPEHRQEYLDDPQDRYNRIREAAGSFCITQLGLSCFRPLPDGSYEATTFNAYVFPENTPGTTPAVRFMSDSSSLSFLANNHFDFNKWVREGVPYMAIRQHQTMMQRFQQEQDRNKQRQEEPRAEVVIDKPEDIAYVDQVVQQVASWLKSSDTPDLMLPRMNGFQRLLAYQELAKPRDWSAGGVAKADAPEPGFFVQKVDQNGWTHIRCVRGDKSAAADAAQQEAQAMQARLQAAAGLAEVMRAMQQCGKPAICHNGFFDVAYVLASFAHGTDLPTLWTDFKGLVGQYFPGGVYDTKHLARNVPVAVLPNGTALGDMYASLTEAGPSRDAALELVRQAFGPSASLPALKHAASTSKYTNLAAGELAHEAGYDAWMTGASFACLAALLAAQASAGGQRQVLPATALANGDGFQLPPAMQQANGRLNISRSDMAYLALTGADPDVTSNRKHVVHLYGGPMDSQGPRAVLDALAAAGLPGRPKITVLSTVTSGGQGGYLVEMDPVLCQDWSAARLHRALAAAQANASATANGNGNGSDTAAAAAPWQVQDYATFYATKQKAMASTFGGSNERRRVGVKRRRVDEDGAAVATGSKEAETEQREQQLQAEARSRCSIM